MKFGMEIKGVVKGQLRTSYGEFSLYCFLITDHYSIDKQEAEHLALVKQTETTWNYPVLSRINSACITSEVFNCQRCDCKWQLDKAMEIIENAGQGIITYHSYHEGRGFGLPLKLLSYNEMDKGISAAESYLKLGLGVEDRRDYRAAGIIFDYFGIQEISLIGNNVRKKKAVESFGIKVASSEALVYDGDDEHVLNYLRKKSNEPEQQLLHDHLVSLSSSYSGVK